MLLLTLFGYLVCALYSLHIPHVENVVLSGNAKVVYLRRSVAMGWLGDLSPAGFNQHWIF